MEVYPTYYSGRPEKSMFDYSPKTERFFHENPGNDSTAPVDMTSLPAYSSVAGATCTAICTATAGDYAENGHTNDVSKTTGTHFPQLPPYRCYTAGGITENGVPTNIDVKPPNLRNGASSDPYPIFTTTDFSDSTNSCPVKYPYYARPRIGTNSRPSTPVMGRNYSPPLYTEPEETGIVDLTNPYQPITPPPYTESYGASTCRQDCASVLPTYTDGKPSTLPNGAGSGSYPTYTAGGTGDSASNNTDYSRDCVRYDTYRPKIINGTRQSNTESYFNGYSSTASDIKPTPLHTSNMDTWQPPFTNSLVLSNCSSVIQSTNNVLDDGKNKVTCAYNGDNAADREPIILSDSRRNDVTVSGHDNCEGTVLPDYDNANGSILNSSKESRACENNGSIGNTMNEIVEDKTTECDGLKSKKKNPIGNSKISGNKNKRKASNQFPESEPADLSPAENKSSKKYKVVTTTDNGEKPRIIPRPAYSYVALIQKAIFSTPEKKMTLQDIYKYILANFEYFRYCPQSWRNSIRHNLSLNKCFVRIPREGGGEKKAGYWTYVEMHDREFQNNNMRRRVRVKGYRGKLEPAPAPSPPVSSTFTPTFSPAFSPHPYHNQFFNYSADLIPHSYRSGDKKLPVTPVSSAGRRPNRPNYLTCPRPPVPALNREYVPPYIRPVRIETSTITSQTPIPSSHAYSANNYTSTPAFPDHYPSQWASQQNYPFRSY